jgi:hypothetical protein
VEVIPSSDKETPPHYEIFIVQQMHYFLKHKILQFVFKHLKVHFSAPTCFGPLGTSSGSIYQNLAKVTKITVFLKYQLKLTVAAVTRHTATTAHTTS